MTSFFSFLCGNRDTNFTRLRQGYGAAGESTLIDPPSVARLRSITAWRAGEELAPPAIRGNWCNSCLVFPRTKVTTLLLFRQRKLERVAECVSRGDPRFAPLREAPAGGTRCHQRVGDAALPPDSCAFGDGHRLEDKTIHLALRKRVNAKPAQRVANFIPHRRALL